MSFEIISLLILFIHYCFLYVLLLFIFCLFFVFLKKGKKSNLKGDRPVNGNEITFKAIRKWEKMSRGQRTQ